MAELRPGERIVHQVYGPGVLRFVHPGVPGKWPVFGHAVFDRDAVKCGRRILLKDALPEPRQMGPRQVRRIAAGQQQAKAGKDIFEKSKVQLLAHLGDAETALVPSYRIRQRPHGKGRVIVVEEAETGVQHRALTPSVELA